MLKGREWGNAVKKSRASGGSSTCTCLQVRLGDGFLNIIVFLFFMVQHQISI